uniref:Uncharacterized protein n=1 Tax=Timema douglasi TaxID=61478 RepID=A0A7R8VCR2_TIMDO|nr:unnamed protein product [Timema douglasi]
MSDEKTQLVFWPRVGISRKNSGQRLEEEAMHIDNTPPYEGSEPESEAQNTPIPEYRHTHNIFYQRFQNLLVRGAWRCSLAFLSDGGGRGRPLRTAIGEPRTPVQLNVVRVVESVSCFEVHSKRVNRESIVLTPSETQQHFQSPDVLKEVLIPSVRGQLRKYPLAGVHFRNTRVCFQAIAAPVTITDESDRMNTSIQLRGTYYAVVALFRTE